MKRYLITDPAFYTSDARQCAEKILHVNASQSIDYLCLRDKQTEDYAALAKEVVASLPLTLRSKIILHTDYALASELNVYGVHFPSSLLHFIPKAKALDLFVVASTHTLEEARYAQEQGADAITFSPIFQSPGKGEPVGLEKLKEINDRIPIKCFALGGIVTAEHVKACEALDVYGFASIRFFLD